MATRFYLGRTSNDVSPGYDGDWDDTSSMVRFKMFTSAQSTAFSTEDVTETSVTNKYCAGIAQWHSGQFNAYTFAGTETWKLQIRAQESAAAANAKVRYYVRIFSSDGTTQRGSYIFGPGATAETEDSFLENIGKNDTGNANSDMQDGDIIVVDLGGTFWNTSSDPYTLTLDTGDNSGTDLPEDSTETSQYNPWIEVDVDLTPYSGGDETVDIAAPVTVDVVQPTPTVSGGATIDIAAPVTVDVDLPSPEVKTGCTVDIAAPVTVDVDVISPITIQGATVDISAPVNVDVDIQSPTVTGAALVEPSAQTVDVLLNSPTVTLGGDITVDIAAPVTVHVSQESPTVTGDAVVDVTPVNVGVSIPSPSVIAEANVGVSPVGVSASILSPTVTGSALVTPSVISVGATVNSPSVSTVTLVQVSAQSMGVVLPSPDIITSASIADVGPANVHISLNSPFVYFPLPQVEMHLGKGLYFHKKPMFFLDEV